MTSNETLTVESLRAKVNGTLREYMPGADGEADARTMTDALWPLFQDWYNVGYEEGARAETYAYWGADQ